MGRRGRQRVVESFSHAMLERRIGELLREVAAC
jgi:hypothetical protein